MKATNVARCLACLTLCSPAVAGIIVIDDDGGPGVDFTDIPPAVAAALPGDTLWIHAGSYSAFTIDGKHLSLLGLDAGQVLVTGSSAVKNLQLGLVTSLADLNLARLNLADNWGAIVLDGVALQPGNSAFIATSSFDVRAIGLNLPQYQGNVSQSSPSACSLNSSRVELTASFIAAMAGVGYDDCDGGTANSGATALTADGASKLHLAGTSVLGGSGASVGNSSCCMLFCDCYPGNGGHGVFATGTSLILAMGNSNQSLVNGSGGKWCSKTGAAGCALLLSGTASAFVSGVSVTGGLCDQSMGSIVQVSPRDPWLDRVFTPVAGGQIRFNVHGEIGDVVTLYLGRKPLVVPLPGVQVEMLTSEERAFELGPIGAQGFATKSFTVPSFMPKGLTFYAQARVLRGAQELRTNSTPIVVR